MNWPLPLLRVGCIPRCLRRAPCGSAPLKPCGTCTMYRTLSPCLPLAMTAICGTCPWDPAAGNPPAAPTCAVCVATDLACTCRSPDQPFVDAMGVAVTPATPALRTGGAPSAFRRGGHITLRRLPSASDSAGSGLYGTMRPSSRTLLSRASFLSRTSAISFRRLSRSASLAFSWASISACIAASCSRNALLSSISWSIKACPSSLPSPPWESSAGGPSSSRSSSATAFPSTSPLSTASCSTGCCRNWKLRATLPGTS
mmetsp:Transcript_45060/g.104381  ORF Transcript_45060/g.104381 Transcript_45060/m.104381 type:complete len:257 (+) Transcript_45060:614-1384(+)